MGRSWGVEPGNCPYIPWDVDVGDPCGLWWMEGDGCWQWPSCSRAAEWEVRGG